MAERFLEPRLESEPRPDEKIIAEIISEKEETEEAYLEKYIIHLLQYGSKRLKVKFDLAEKKVTTFVENIYSRFRKEKQTTLLYGAAKKLIQDMANEKGMTLNIHLKQKMKKCLIGHPQRALRCLVGIKRINMMIN